MILKLNTIDFTADIEGEDKSYTVNISKKTEKKLQAKRVSNELTFSGAAYDLIKAELIDHSNARMNKVDFLALDDCCLDTDGNPAVAFEGIIRADMISWCDGDCFIKGTAIEHTAETRQYDCFKNTLIADDRNGFRSQAHPRMTYCNELRPDWLHDVILIFGMLFVFILAILTPIVFVISLFVQIFCFIAGVIPGVSCPPGLQDGILDDYTEFMNTMTEIIVGCGRQHPSPLARSYIGNVCTICGLSFQSTILNDSNSDYYDTVYFNAPVEKGTRDIGVLYIDVNLPIHNGESFMEEIKKPFAADWYVRGGAVIFEREDFFWTGNIWISLQDIIDQDRLEGKVCYTWRDENKNAYGRFEYTLDAVDVVGNEAKDRHNEIVEWNNPVNELQTGEFRETLPYGMTRYRGDGIDRDVLSAYENFPFLSSVIGDFEDVLIMDRGVAFNPKLLIWDSNSGVAEGRVKKYSISGHDVPDAENFNFPYMFNETNVALNTIYPPNQPNMALYGRFHAWKNPKCSIDRGLEFTFAFRFTCDEIRSFDIYKNIQFPTQTGRMTDVDIDYTNNIITVKGAI